MTARSRAQQLRPNSVVWVSLVELTVPEPDINRKFRFELGEIMNNLVGLANTIFSQQDLRLST